MENNGVVIDLGSGVTKVGFSEAYQGPPSWFPTVVGRKRAGLEGIEYLNPIGTCAGDQSMAKRGALTLNYPIKRGIVENWEDVNIILRHCFNELHVAAEQHPTLISGISCNSKANRQKMTEQMFQTFKVPKFYLAKQSTLSMYHSGRTTGLVVQSGEGVTEIVPIIDGHPLCPAIQVMDFAGSDLNEYLRFLLYELGLHFQTQWDVLIRGIKEKACYVALNFNAELQAYKDSNEKKMIYQLPDMQTIQIDSQRFRCPENLFKPTNVHWSGPGIPQMIINTIKKCDPDFQRDFYQNIILSGGNTLFPGFPERLSQEITALAPAIAKIKVIALADRMFSTWVGGSILSSLSTFQQMWISKAEYYETGPAIIHRKCP